MDSNLPVVRVNGKAADRLRSGHPWIYSSDVLDTGSAQPGDAARIAAAGGRSLGVAHYSSTSQIQLRLLSKNIEAIDEAFLLRRIEAAFEYRKRVVANSSAYRLVYSEGDFLPGLVVDRYADWLVIQALSQGMDRLTGAVAKALEQLLRPAGIVARNDAGVRVKENLPQETRVLAGDVPESVEVRMNGLKCRADLLTGQKTGLFLDQRENYLAVQRYARGRALDCFTATGGFALHLASVCDHVEALDSSEPALVRAKANAAANGIANIDFRQADILHCLPGMAAAHRQFDLIVLDPPAFTKSRAALDGAVRGYKEVNRRALNLLRTGGVLVSCSCSHHMSEAHLLEIIAGAALDAGKQLRILERRTQSQDHPILLTVPETHYLKCLIFEVL